MFVECGGRSSNQRISIFASADSRTKARLIPVCESALRLNGAVVDPLAYHIVELQMVQERIHEFDVVHYHLDYLHFPLSRFSRTPQLTTLHGRPNIPELQRARNSKESRYAAKNCCQSGQS